MEKLVERDMVISTLAHSIKNTIAASVLGPLNELKNRELEHEGLVEQALSGAEVICRMINVMKNINGGSFDDFIYDATNFNEEATTVSSIIYESLHTGIANMFDGKNFYKFSRNYFKEYDIFINAMEEFQELEKDDFDALKKFVKKYFFALSVHIDLELSELIIGDAKGSATKLLILFQEILLNAIKYTGYQAKEDRGVKLILEILPDNMVSFTVENTKGETEEKEGGLGSLIMRKLTELMRGQIIIEKIENKYIVISVFDNFWNSQ